MYAQERNKCPEAHGRCKQMRGAYNGGGSEASVPGIKANAVGESVGYGGPELIILHLHIDASSTHGRYQYCTRSTPRPCTNVYKTLHYSKSRGAVLPTSLQVFLHLISFQPKCARRWSSALLKIYKRMCVRRFQQAPLTGRN